MLSTQEIPYSVEDFNYSLTSGLLDRIDTLGPDLSGAYRYYENRVNNGNLISKDEADVFSVVRSIFDDSISIHDIGGGIGSLAMLFAFYGHQSVNIERNRKRVEAADGVWSTLPKRYEQVQSNFSTINSEFPLVSDEPMDVSNTIAVITNLIGTITDTTQLAMIKRLRDYRGVVLDTQKFCCARETQAEYDTLNATFESYGFTKITVVLDLGSQGRYVSYS